MITVIEPGLRQTKKWDFDTKNRKLEAASFRLLFGGGIFGENVKIDDHFFSKIKSLAQQFPFYIPVVDRSIRQFYEKHKGVPMFAFFETPFFEKLPDEEKYYAIPQEYFQKTSIKRQGFHGIFHKHNASLAGSQKKIISVVLDRQTTVSAIDSSRPLSISLGYTPLEGIMGRTSCGDLDPGIVFYLMKRYNLSIFKIDEILKSESGFYGLTGYDIDIDELFRFYGKDKKVDFAFLVYQNQILKYIGEGISVLKGFDAIVFSGCYAKTLAPLIYNLIKKISFLGITLEALPWKNNLQMVSSENSRVKVYLDNTSVACIIFEETKNII